MAALCAFLLRYGSRYDVFHVHQYGYHAAMAAVLGRLLGRPIVLKLTSTGPDGIARTLGCLRLGGRLLSGLHRRVDACIATTSAARDEAIRFGIPEGRIAVIPNGVDTGVYSQVPAKKKAAIRADLGLGEGPVALFCGRLSPEKNVAGLLTAWRNVSAALPEAQLVIIGGGPERPSLEAIIKSGDGGRGIVLVGETKDVSPWYHAADLFVLPSHHEGLSNSLLEAMSCGLPVVSTRVSGSTEILGAVEAGRLVNVGDMTAFGAAILELLSSPVQSAALGARARNHAVAHFSINAVAVATEDIYRRVLLPPKD